MKKIILLFIYFIYFNCFSQTTNPTSTRFTNGLLVPNKVTAPFLGVGSLWWQSGKLSAYNGSVWQNILTETLASSTYASLVNVIQNQTSINQSASFNISGSGKFGNGITYTLTDGSGLGATPQIINSQTTGAALMGVIAADGTNNYRIGLFSDNTAGLTGITIQGTSSNPPFVIRKSNAEYLRIVSSGNIIIGSTIDAGQKLQIQGRQYLSQLLQGISVDSIVVHDNTSKELKRASLANLGIAPLNSPALTGTPTAPTAAPGTNTTQIATTAFVTTGLATKQNSITSTGYAYYNGTSLVAVNGGLNDMVLGNGGFISIDPRARAVKITTVTPNNTAIANGDNIQQVVDKTQGQIDELKSHTGWAQYSDNVYTSGSPLVINSGATATITNNSGSVISNQLPSGVSSFYNSTTSKITPELNGDSYLINVRFTAVSSSNTGLADIFLDVTGAVGTLPRETISLRKGAGNAQNINVIFDVFSGSAFVANGGLIRLNSIDGNTSIYDISYKVTRTHKAK